MRETLATKTDNGSKKMSPICHKRLLFSARMRLVEEGGPIKEIMFPARFAMKVNKASLSTGAPGRTAIDGKF